MIQRCNTVLLQLMCIHKNKAVSIETACMICPRSRGGIAFAGADDGTLYLNLIPLPSHVLLPRCKDMKILNNNICPKENDLPVPCAYKS